MAPNFEWFSCRRRIGSSSLTMEKIGDASTSAEHPAHYCRNHAEEEDHLDDPLPRTAAALLAHSPRARRRSASENPRAGGEPRTCARLRS